MSSSTAARLVVVCDYTPEDCVFASRGLQVEEQILEAEGDKQNSILVAEGNRQKEILIAEGDRQAAMLRAEGEAKAIETVSTAANAFFIGNAQLLKQLEVTQASLQDNTKLVVSDQSRLINVLGLGEALDEARSDRKSK